MPTDVHPYDKLIQHAMRLGGHRTKIAAITRALEDYIRYLEQEKILDLFGTVEFNPDYDYREQRRKKADPYGRWRIPP